MALEATAKIRAGLVTTTLQFVAGAGGNPTHMRAIAKLRQSELLDPEQMIDADRVALALRAAAEELDDPAFGLHLGANFDLDAFGLLSYAVLNADTVGTGLNNLVRFVGSLTQGVCVKVRASRGRAALRLGVEGMATNSARHLQEAGTMMAVRMLRRLVGDEAWHPLAVVFRHGRPQGDDEHRRLFGIAPSFGGRFNEIRFDASVLQREVPETDRSLLPIVEQRLQEVLLETASEEPWLVDLRLQVASRLCDGHPSLPIIAAQVGVGARTLRRRLAERGIVYRDLVQQARRQLALRYLENTAMDLTEVAFLLGYSELSAFTHAFSRWTGTSPGAHRRARQNA